MASELEELTARAGELAEVASGRPEGQRARRLAERLASGRFLVSMVGEFKRGKSTLLNAMLGAQVVPTGVLPLTAVPTEVAFGEPDALVEHLDGTRRSIRPMELPEYVTEAGNPNNHRQVARVEVRGPWNVLASGVVLVDSPGIGSVYRHNSETAHAALLDADGAVLVLSADAPFSEQERQLLSLLAGRQKPTFFVLNKVDHLSPTELLGQVRRFVEQTLNDQLGRRVPVYAMAAQRALDARLGGRAPGPDAGEFNAFSAEFEAFVADSLVDARLTSARSELARLGGSFRDSVAVEQAALDVDAATLSRQAERFRVEAARQREAFDEDCTILARDVTRLRENMTKRLADFARAAPAQHVERLETVARAARAKLEDDLRAAIEVAVRESFESFRTTEAERTEAAWRTLAERFRARAQLRVDAVRQAAARLFSVPLPQVTVPTVDEERESFFYLFIHVGASTESFSRVIGLLVPGRLARRRTLAWAQGELVREFDKHAGRAHWDLGQRLDEVRRRFQQAMRAELSGCTEAILEAAARAEDLRRSAEDEHARRDFDIQRQRQLATTLVGLAEQPDFRGTDQSADGGRAPLKR